MDEEDGRLGPTARQPGRVDVLMDALTTSLCHSVHTHSKSSRSFALFAGLLRHFRSTYRVSFQGELL
jgi:hypothetical protein